MAKDGCHGARLTEESTEAAAVVVDRLSELGKHGRMPYREVPEDVWSDDDATIEWASLSADLARS